jgi:hypothetical protein
MHGARIGFAPDGHVDSQWVCKAAGEGAERGSLSSARQ